MPGRYEQSREELERSLEDASEGRSKLKKRSINPLAWATRRAQASEVRKRAQQSRRRGAFSLESPDER